MSLRCLCCILLFLAGPALADNKPLRFEITPFGGYRIGGSFDVEDEQGNELRSTDFKEHASYGLGLALYRDPNGFYCGHKFGSEGISAVWFCEEDEIKVYSPDRSLVLVAQADDASPVPLRRAA